MKKIIKKDNYKCDFNHKSNKNIKYFFKSHNVLKNKKAKSFVTINSCFYLGIYDFILLK